MNYSSFAGKCKPKHNLLIAEYNNFLWALFENKISTMFAKLITIVRKLLKYCLCNSKKLKPIKFREWENGRKNIFKGLVKNEEVCNSKNKCIEKPYVKIEELSLSVPENSLTMVHWGFFSVVRTQSFWVLPAHCFFFVREVLSGVYSPNRRWWLAFHPLWQHFSEQSSSHQNVLSLEQRDEQLPASMFAWFGNDFD